MSDDPAKADKPIFLGVRHEFHYQSKVELPKGYTPNLLPEVDLDRDYADYHSAYSFKGGALLADRQLTIKGREVPASGRESYRAFQKAVSDDGGSYTYLNTPGSSPTVVRGTNPEAQKLLAQAREAYQQQRLKEALELCDRATKIDPESKEVWSIAGNLHVLSGQDTEQGLADLRKAIEIDPKDTGPYKMLAFTLTFSKRGEEAMQVWRDLLKQEPNDREAHAGLGGLLLDAKRYREAAPELEAAARSSPPRAWVEAELARAYFGLGDKERAVAAIRKSVEIDPTPDTWNRAAYYLAENNEQLAEAEQYAKKAVLKEEQATEKLALDQLGIDKQKSTTALSYHWDTLGWVYFHEANLEKAEKYIRASWMLSQKSIVADHLGQVYEKQGEKQSAIRLYAAAVAIDPAATEARARLDRLAGTRLRSETAIGAARDRLSLDRTVTLTKSGSRRGSAQFLVLFTAGPKVEEVKFLEGPDDMRSLDKAITAAKFDVPFPDDAPTRLVRQGMVYCGQMTGCQFVFMPPESTP